MAEHVLFSCGSTGLGGLGFSEVCCGLLARVCTNSEDPGCILAQSVTLLFQFAMTTGTVVTQPGGSTRFLWTIVTVQLHPLAKSPSPAFL